MSLHRNQQKQPRHREEDILKIEQSKNRQHLLILGAPRSGTTLLTAMMGRHDEVALLVEEKRLAFTKVVSKTVVGNKLCVPSQIEFEDKWDERYARFSKYAIEKYLELPNFHAILIVRNGNDVVNSIMTREDKSLEVSSYYWTRAIEIMYELKRRLQSAALVISYEGLLANPEGQMKRAAEFLGLDYQPKMLDGYKFNPIYPEYSGIDVSKAQPKKEKPAPINLQQSHPEIWKKYLELNSSAVIV
jgi:hypothetical protein